MKASTATSKAPKGWLSAIGWKLLELLVIVVIVSWLCGNTLGLIGTTKERIEAEVRTAIPMGITRVAAQQYFESRNVTASWQPEDAKLIAYYPNIGHDVFIQRFVRVRITVDSQEAVRDVEVIQSISGLP